ncbi:MAG: DNA methylase [Lachnospiraceae bacterium]|nr:DNA methylase [Lachnospiraceae bacterium]
MDKERIYIAIDLKSFYASVECAERSLDPLKTNLVVADASRTEKTICLAVSPSLKAYGIPGRARLFEVLQKLEYANSERLKHAPNKTFTSSSCDAVELADNPAAKIDFITAVPRMSLYMQYSTKIYSIYLKYISSNDIHVYSCDEVFMDVTDYLELYGLSAHELARKIINDVLAETHITATVGIGTNLFLCKIAMDIVAKHIPADKDGVRIAELDERKFRELLWDHQPLTDFWRIGPGTARSLHKLGIYTLGELARFSEKNEDTLYKIFGINAELIIDHAWGWEPCTIEYIKQFRPETNSISTGQVLTRPYKYSEAQIIVREMADNLSLDLVEKKLLTAQLVLNIGYESFKDARSMKEYAGEIKLDHYGRYIPKYAHGTINLSRYTSSTRMIINACLELFEEITDPNLFVRRINITACNIVLESDYAKKDHEEQMSLFVDYSAKEKEEAELEREKRLQLASLEIKKKYGKNALLKGTDFLEGATSRERNMQIGGHRS